MLEFKAVGKICKGRKIVEREKIVGDKKEVTNLVNFTIYSRGKDGGKGSYLNCEAWGDIADFLNQYCKDGDIIFASGYIKQNMLSQKINFYNFVALSIEKYNYDMKNQQNELKEPKNSKEYLEQIEAEEEQEFIEENYEDGDAFLDEEENPF